MGSMSTPATQLLTIEGGEHSLNDELPRILAALAEFHGLTDPTDCVRMDPIP